jgi:hypothetical protein
VVFIFYRHGKDIVKQLERLTKLKVPGVESEFSEGIKEAEKKAEAANLPDVVAPTPTEKPVSITWDKKASPEAWIDRYPEIAILQAWKEVEEAVSDKYGRQIKGNRVIHAPQEIRPVYEQLRQLRNKAAHGGPGQIRAADAEEFIQLSKRLLAQVEKTDSPPRPLQGSDVR